VIEHFESAKNNTMAYHAALAQVALPPALLNEGVST